MVLESRFTFTGAGVLRFPSIWPSRVTVHSASLGSELTLIDCVVPVVIVAQPPPIAAARQANAKRSDFMSRAPTCLPFDPLSRHQGLLQGLVVRHLLDCLGQGLLQRLPGIVAAHQENVLDRSQSAVELAVDRRA